MGREWIVEEIEWGDSGDWGKVMEVMGEYLGGEFLGGVREVVGFGGIDENVGKEILKVDFGRLEEEVMKEKKMELNLWDEGLEDVGKKGYCGK